MRKNELKKTSKPNIYEILSVSGRKEYVVRFSYLSKNYGQRNFTKLFGTTTLNQTQEMFQNVKVELSRGNNPFVKRKSISLDTLFGQHIKSLKGQHQYIIGLFYKKHIQPKIGKYDVDEIEEKHIYEILNTTLKDSSSTHRMKLRTSLNLIFKKLVKKGIIKLSPLEFIKFEKPKNREELSTILVNDFETVSKKLYRGILEVEKIEDRLSLLFSLMCARRRGEIVQYEHQMIRKMSDGSYKVFVPNKITKINKNDEFPLPLEMVKLIKQLPKINNNKLYELPVQRLTKKFNKVVEDCDIQLTKDERFTLHQCRHLFQSIMIPKTSNPPLVDRCLSHTQSSSLSVYYSLSYESRKKVFEEYWEIIRGV